MYKYKYLKEEYDQMDLAEPSGSRQETNHVGNGIARPINSGAETRRSSRQEQKDEFHTQFSEEDFQKDLNSRTKVIGPGGIVLPRLSELPQLVDENGKVTVMCFTWNIAGKAQRGLHRLNAVFSKISSKERPDIIAVALQELPSSTIKFHSHVVEVVGEALSTTHRVFCWVRKWSQMMIIFIRKRLSVYTSHPEYKFIATSRVAKPFKTKGAIGICFRLLQTSCVFIACHLTHGKLHSRIMDYQKLSKTFDFDCLHRLPASVLSPPSPLPMNGSASVPGAIDRAARSINSKPQSGSNSSANRQRRIAWSSKNDADSQELSSSNGSSHLLPALLSPGIPQTNSVVSAPLPLPIKRAANVFWFGDLNFRVQPIQTLVGIGRRLENRLFRRTHDYQPIIEHDELNVERSKGLLFADFKEGVIKFPPTHKFILGTNSYAENRVPSYTDRVLYWSKSSGSLVPLRYDCIWEITTSDHKPVYCLFSMKAVERAKPMLPYSLFAKDGSRATTQQFSQEDDRESGRKLAFLNVTTLFLTLSEPVSMSKVAGLRGAESCYTVS
ncbi:phosphatidylinositol 3,4,5-trisphosphate 5-phosphatase 2 [Ditylenchus destructor]|uniref:Phosphatidylinositol 3,4,5-trisphosphate 5-phosphatase 2 n=1 Tax=Ditylenchus destructor TaxID=166010 RepID=A0AAD4MYM3_9BILA|nr:phosphatidylinositol 3,4,5-trisphosphate 5-phosphatase 2 [Ditylenchus destructor]